MMWFWWVLIIFSALLILVIVLIGNSIIKDEKMQSKGYFYNSVTGEYEKKPRVIYEECKK